MVQCVRTASTRTKTRNTDIGSARCGTRSAVRLSLQRRQSGDAHRTLGPGVLRTTILIKRILHGAYKTEQFYHTKYNLLKPCLATTVLQWSKNELLNLKFKNRENSEVRNLAGWLTSHTHAHTDNLHRCTNILSQICTAVKSEICTSILSQICTAVKSEICTNIIPQLFHNGEI